MNQFGKNNVGLITLALSLCCMRNYIQQSATLQWTKIYQNFFVLKNAYTCCGPNPLSLSLKIELVVLEAGSYRRHWWSPLCTLGRQGLLPARRTCPRPRDHTSLPSLILWCYFLPISTCSGCQLEKLVGIYYHQNK